MIEYAAVHVHLNRKKNVLKPKQYRVNVKDIPFHEPVIVQIWNNVGTFNEYDTVNLIDGWK